MLKIQGARAIQNFRFFPFTSRNLRNFKYFALVGLRSNIEDEKRRFRALFRLLMDDRRFKILQTSPLLINRAFGYEKQKDFTNAVLLAQINLHAGAFLKVLLYYEVKFKRKRIFKNAPRTLDSDLLYFSQRTKKGFRCRVPHSGAKERISVILLLGLMEGLASGIVYLHLYS